MPFPRRLRLAFLVAALAAIISTTAGSPADASLADGPCPPGTSWDNKTQTCR